MLDFIYYPVSAILWFWHEVFGFVLDPASGFAWALAVIFLVFTLRALLYKPFVHQVRSMKKMQEFAPLMRDLQSKHGDDRQKLAEEMQKLQAEQGFNPLSGCLPMLVQIPVFIGLFHVLNGFKPGAQSNFIFDADDVRSFVAADLFGAKLSNHLSQSSEVLSTFGTDHSSMLLVAVPLMIAAAIATHFTARHSVQRQSSEAANNPQAAMMGKLTLWIFPMFAIIGGPFLPLAILIYWLANNFWTLGQQRVVYRKIDREEAASAEKPDAPVVVDSAVVDSAGVNSAGVNSTAVDSVVVETSSESSESHAAEAGKDQPGDIPGAIEDRSRDTDQPGEPR